VVLAVGSLSKITAWIDRYIIDGLVNLVSLATIFSGSALKYNVSGQSQFYVLTILLGIGGLIWLLLNGQWSLITNYWSSLLTH
jgi:NAD(P)H-quinone oxidoreductase subunit 5